MNLLSVIFKADHQISSKACQNAHHFYSLSANPHQHVTPASPSGLKWETELCTDALLPRQPFSCDMLFCCSAGVFRTSGPCWCEGRCNTRVTALPRATVRCDVSQKPVGSKVKTSSPLRKTFSVVLCFFFKCQNAIQL